MLDMKFVRDNLSAVQDMLKNRNNALDLTDFAELEKKRRELLGKTEELKARRNSVSKEISQLKKAGENADNLVAEMRGVGDEINAIDQELKVTEEKLKDILLHIPNMPKADVPIGKDDTENPEVRK